MDRQDSILIDGSLHGPAKRAGGTIAAVLQQDIEAQAGTVVDLRRVTQERVSRERIRSAKAGFATRRVHLSDAVSLVRGRSPFPGDLVLAEVQSIGHHSKLEAPSGRRRELHPGDDVILAYGARYASDQFDAVVPRHLRSCDLIAAGGLAGRVVSRHSRTRKPTRLKPVGLLADKQGRVLNLRDYALGPPTPTARQPIVIAIVGTSMNSGKTRTCASLIRGLSLAGIRVGAAKLTGTGSGNDPWSMVDAGAAEVLDFTDMGYPSTHQVPHDEVLKIALGLLDNLAAAGHEMAVVEIADGLFQSETAMLLNSPEFQARINGLIFAAGDSMGALAGLNWLAERGLPVLGFSGLVTASPLARSEAEAAARAPSFSIGELSDPQFAPKICLGTDPMLGAVAGRIR